MQTSDAVIETLTATLMEAYQALYIADQEGPLGEKISAVLHETRRYLSQHKDRTEETAAKHVRFAIEEILIIEPPESQQYPT